MFSKRILSQGLEDSGQCSKGLTLYRICMPILGPSNSAANKDMMSKIWTNRDTTISMNRKHCGKRRNCW